MQSCTLNMEVVEVCNYLKTKFIQIPTNNEWLTSCVECFKEQGNYSLKELKEQVYQQWLLADLADIGVRVLPNNCLTEDKFVLEGKYAVQFNFFVNVAVSFHKQLQTHRRPDVLKNLEINSEVETEQQPKYERSVSRILKIEVTDGVVTLMGFEDQYISALQEPYVPGKKAVLVGPIECRKSVLFLKPKNLILLGGEVDALLITNATENILARKLNLPENPDPYSQHLNGEVSGLNANNASEEHCLDDDEEAMMMLAEVIEKKVPDNLPGGTFSSDNTQNSTRTSSSSNRLLNRNNSNVAESKSNSAPRSNCHQQSQSFQMEHSNCQFEKSRPNTTLVSSNTPSHSVFSVPQQYSAVDFDDDFDWLAVQTAASAEEHQSFGRREGIDEVASKFNTYEIFDSASIKKDIKEMNDLKKKLNESYNSELSIQSSSSASQSIYNRKVVVDYLSDNVSPLINLSDELDKNVFMKNCSTVGASSNEACFSVEPFPPRKRPSIVTAFAKVVKVLKKPKLKDDKWSVSALVEAKGIELEATFDSYVIDKVFTITAAEILARRDELASDPVMKQKMNEALKESQLRFSKLACEMTFSFKDAISNPLVVGVNAIR